jgi:hypothetical protein
MVMLEDFESLIECGGKLSFPPHSIRLLVAWRVERKVLEAGCGGGLRRRGEANPLMVEFVLESRRGVGKPRRRRI